MLVTGANPASDGSDHGIELILEVSSGEEPAPLFLVVHLNEHDEIAVTWKAGIAVSRRGTSNVWAGSFPWADEEAPRVLTVSGVTYEDPSTVDLQVEPPLPGTQVEVPSAHSFAFARVSDGADTWVSGKDAKAEVADMAARRERRFATSIIAPGSPANASKWVVVILIDQVLLTTEAYVPGIHVQPLARGAGGNPEITLLNAVLNEIGFGEGLNEIEAVPKAIATVPNVVASTFQQAVEVAVDRTTKMMDIVGLNRHASPRLVAAAVGTREPNGRITTVKGASLLPGYSGNLAGGIISGEDPRHLNEQWRAISEDARISLWLRLLNEGASDQRWDYQVFRAFNLLEGIAREIFPNKAVSVVREDGTPRLQVNNRPYTSEQARGVVSLLVGLCMVPTPSPRGGTYPSAPSAGNAIADDFWDQLSLWVEVRNRVAHAGSWAYPLGATPKSTWLTHDTQLRAPGGINELVRATRNTVHHVLHHALTRGL